MGNSRSVFRVPKNKQFPDNVLLCIARHLIKKDASLLLPLWQSCKLFNQAFGNLGKNAKIVRVFEHLCDYEGWRVKFYVTKSDITKQFLRNCVRSNDLNTIHHEKHYDAILFGYSNIWIENNEPIFLVFRDTLLRQSQKYIGNKIIIKCVQNHNSRRDLYLFFNESKKRMKWLYFDKNAENRTITILIQLE